MAIYVEENFLYRFYGYIAVKVVHRDINEYIHVVFGWSPLYAKRINEYIYIVFG